MVVDAPFCNNSRMTPVLLSPITYRWRAVEPSQLLRLFTFALLCSHLYMYDVSLVVTCCMWECSPTKPTIDMLPIDFYGRNKRSNNFLCAKLVSTAHSVQSSNLAQTVMAMETKSFPVQINLPVISNSHIFFWKLGNVTMKYRTKFKSTQFNLSFAWLHCHKQFKHEKLSKQNLARISKSF